MLDKIIQYLKKPDLEASSRKHDFMQKDLMKKVI